MTTVSQDTDPAAVQLMEACYARMTPADKLCRVRQLTLAVSRLALAGLQTRHPDLDQAELLRELALLRLGPESFASAYPPTTEPDGALRPS